MPRIVSYLTAPSPALLAGVRRGRLLHVLVHIDGTVDHHQPDHRDRDKRNNQRRHLCPPLTPPASAPEQPRAALWHARSKVYRPRRGPSWRYLAARRSKWKASVEPEHRSMAVVAHGATHRMRGRRPVSIECNYALQQKIASVDQSWCLRRGAARHKFSVNTICS
jgi:hypothetical protein